MKVHPVVGKVLVNGRPADNAMVAFHPLGTSAAGAHRPVGTTGQDGTFRLTTFEVGDGAPQGTYAVTLVWPDRNLPVDECEGPLAHDRFRGRYADPTRAWWQATVGPGPNEVLLEVAQGW